MFSLIARGVLEPPHDFLKDGGRKIDAWYATLKSWKSASTTSRNLLQYQHARRPAHRKTVPPS